MEKNLTREQAKSIIDAHDILYLLGNEEELKFLQKQNPVLLEAYFMLHRIAFGIYNPKVINLKRRMS